MMNKKGGFGDLLVDNVVYLILLVIFMVGMFWYLQNSMNGAAIWEDYYAKEIVKVINFAEPGDSVWLNVQQGVVIAKKNKVNSLSEIFQIDNANNEVCVKLSKGRKSCYSFFNDADVIDVNLDWDYESEINGQGFNKLGFRIIETQRVEEENVEV